MYEIEKNNTPSVDDGRRWLKRLGRSEQDSHTTLMLMILTKTKLSRLQEDAIEMAKVGFCKVLNISRNLDKLGNRCNFRYYIDKIFDEIPEDDQEWVVDYIHLERMKSREKCDKQWDLMKINLKA